jgi:hypothetical protein
MAVTADYDATARVSALACTLLAGKNRDDGEYVIPMAKLLRARELVARCNGGRLVLIG